MRRQSPRPPARLRPEARPQLEGRTRPEGILFTVFALAAVAGLLVAAAWAGLTVVAAPLGMVLALAVVSWAWSHWSLTGVACECDLSASRVFPGEELHLSLRLINRKLLPLSWLSVRTEIPAGLESAGTARPAAHGNPMGSQFVDPAADPAGNPATATIIEHSTAIPAYASASWVQRVVCRRRGYYPLGPMAVASGDAFGLYPRAAVVENSDAVIVYPRLFDLRDLGLPARAFLGEVRAGARLFEDPSRTVGVREYLPGDSLRGVHWKATARQGRLQVRVHEQTTTHKAALFLVADDCAELSHDDFELAVSATASAARFLVEQGGQVGLWANTRAADTGRPARLPAAGGQDQLVQILEALAKVTRSSSGDFVSFFAAERAGLSFGTTPVFILGRAHSHVRTILADLRDSGLQPVVAQVGEAPPGGRVPGVVWHVVRRPAVGAGRGRPQGREVAL